MNRKKIESTVRSQNLCSPVTRKNKPGAVKKILLSFALLGCVTGASAQEAAETAAPDISAAATPSTGDYFGGLTRPLTFDRICPAYLRMAATPGSSLPSMYSSSAPPPVET